MILTNHRKKVLSHRIALDMFGVIPKKYKKDFLQTALSMLEYILSHIQQSMNSSEFEDFLVIATVKFFKQGEE